MMRRPAPRRPSLRKMPLTLRPEPAPGRPPDSGEPATSGPVVIDDTVEKLAWLAKIKDAGLLTVAELELTKARVLSRSCR